MNYVFLWESSCSYLYRWGRAFGVVIVVMQVGRRDVCLLGRRDSLWGYAFSIYSLLFLRLPVTNVRCCRVWCLVCVSGLDVPRERWFRSDAE
jgi:hypothetical protein